MAFALNNLKRVDMPLNKETKPNHWADQETGGAGSFCSGWMEADDNNSSSGFSGGEGLWSLKMSC